MTDSLVPVENPEPVSAPVTPTTPVVEPAQDTPTEPAPAHQPGVVQFSVTDDIAHVAPPEEGSPDVQPEVAPETPPVEVPPVVPATIPAPVSDTDAQLNLMLQDKAFRVPYLQRLRQINPALKFADQFEAELNEAANPSKPTAPVQTDEQIAAEFEKIVVEKGIGAANLWLHKTMTVPQINAAQTEIKAAEVKRQADLKAAKDADIQTRVKQQIDTEITQAEKEFGDAFERHPQAGFRAKDAKLNGDMYAYMNGNPNLTYSEAFTLALVKNGRYSGKRPPTPRPAASKAVPTAPASGTTNQYKPGVVPFTIVEH